MRYTYDADADALLIELHAGIPVARTVEVDESRHVDLDEAGQVIAVEILWASTGVQIDDLIDRFDLWGYKAFLQEVAHKSFRPAVSI